MGQEASGAIVDAWKGRLVRSGDNLFAGGHYLFSAAGWLRNNPTKLGYIAVPMCINVVLTFGALFTAIRYGGALWAVIVPSDTGGLLMSIGSWVASVAIFVLLLLFVYVLSSVVALPFNERLSEHVEISELGDASELVTIGRVVGDIWLSLTHSIGAGLIWVSVMLFALLLTFIPVIGPFVYIATAWIVTATFLAREVIDSSLSRHRLSFREKTRVVRSHYTVLLGLGGVAALVLWIPLLNFLMMPLSIVGGTLFYCDLVRDGQVPRDPRTPRSIQ